MKKSKKEEGAALTLAEVAALYKSFATTAKESEKNAKPYKEMLVAYAQEHPEQFSGNTLECGQGVCVEMREQVKPAWNAEAVDDNWLTDALDVCLEDAIDVKVDARKMKKAIDAEQQKVLDAIGYHYESGLVYAVKI